MCFQNLRSGKNFFCPTCERLTMNYYFLVAKLCYNFTLIVRVSVSPQYYRRNVIFSAALVNRQLKYSVKIFIHITYVNLVCIVLSVCRSCFKGNKSFFHKGFVIFFDLLCILSLSFICYYSCTSALKLICPFLFSIFYVPRCCHPC